VAADQAVNFRWSSLARLAKGSRFPNLIAEDWLRALGLTDTSSGWSDYIESLVDLASNQEEQKRQGFDQLSRGWAIGTIGWRRAVAHDHAHRAISPGIEAEQNRELKEARWQRCLDRIMREAKRTQTDAMAAPKSASWKIALATKLRREEGASIPWIAQTLYMGKPGAVRGYLSRDAARQGN